MGKGTVYFSYIKDLVCGLSPDLFTPSNSILRLGTVYFTMGRAGEMLQSSRKRSMTDDIGPCVPNASLLKVNLSFSFQRLLSQIFILNNTGFS